MSWFYPYQINWKGELQFSRHLADHFLNLLNTRSVDKPDGMFSVFCHRWRRSIDDNSKDTLRCQNRCSFVSTAFCPVSCSYPRQSRQRCALWISLVPALSRLLETPLACLSSLWLCGGLVRSCPEALPRLSVSPTETPARTPHSPDTLHNNHIAPYLQCPSS